jgi:hypothetical protein
MIKLCMSRNLGAYKVDDDNKFDCADRGQAYDIVGIALPHASITTL